MRILYGVPSEGMGHATRSQVIIEHLLEQGHQVRIATSDRAFELLDKAFPGRCLRIEGLHLKYERGGVDKAATFAHLLGSAPEGLATNVKQAIHLWRSEPLDLVISDFESFSYTFAKIASLPLLSIDNMQVINRCTLGIEIPDEETESYTLAKTIIKAKVPFCQRYLVTAFFDAEPCKPNTELVPPILRDAVLQVAGERLPEGNHILVYRTASAEDDFIESLRAVQGQHFIVYGLNRDEELGNVTLRVFSEAGFIRELATCRAVVANGGFSLISEAVFLHRPVCSFPLKGQFEQFVNGAQIERLGYGRRFTDFSSDAIKAFLYDRDRFSQSLESYRQQGNQDVFAAVDRFIDDVAQGGLPAEE
ncbi:MAG: teichoic acid biosynthesis protein [Polyangiaceae bacterium]|nr:teichoic acid biosynthesis protein [Polyangiaceae bacterium]